MFGLMLYSIDFTLMQNNTQHSIRRQRLIIAEKSKHAMESETNFHTEYGLDVTLSAYRKR